MTVSELMARLRALPQDAKVRCLGGEFLEMAEVTGFVFYSTENEVDLYTDQDGEEEDE